jgi:ribonucleoside-diphosphate reductase beta chain
MDPEVFTRFRAALAKFGAGEQAVADDLAPLAQVLDGIEDQAFLTTQLYEEAKHADFFDRYWREVVTAAEDAREEPRTAPQDDRWYNDAYDELFERNERAMERLLEDDTAENRAIAYCHYHLTVEGILAQTAYYGMTQAYSEGGDLPHLPGLIEGLSLIRGDEGRHVGFGMRKLKDLVADGVDPQLLHETVEELLPLVNGITVGDVEDESEIVGGPTPDDLRAYAAEKHTERMQQIVDASRDIPDVETLTRLEGD